MRIVVVLLVVLSGLMVAAPGAGAAPIIDANGCLVAPVVDATTGTLEVDARVQRTAGVTAGMWPANSTHGPHLRLESIVASGCPAKTQFSSGMAWQEVSVPLDGVKLLRVMSSEGSLHLRLNVESLASIRPLLDPAFLVESQDAWVQVTSTATRATSARTIDTNGDGLDDVRFLARGHLELFGTSAADTVDLTLLDPEIHTSGDLGGGNDSWSAPADAATSIAPDPHMGAQFAHAIALGDGADTATGTGGADYIDGGRGSDVIDGAAGDDQLHGWRDSLGGPAPLSDPGQDVLRGSAGDDEIDGGAGDDLLVGGDGADDLDGRRGNDRLLGDAGNDQLDGSYDRDILRAGPGADYLTDRRDGNRPLADLLYGDAGNDIVRVGGNALVWGGAGHDRLHMMDTAIGRGGPGDDRLEHQFGVARLYGEDGNDWLVSRNWVRSGLLSGGAGVDQFSMIHVRRESFWFGVRVDCGPGIDRAWSEFPRSRVRGCERLKECWKYYHSPLYTCGSHPWGNPKRDPGYWVHHPW